MCVRYTLHKTEAALSAIARALGRPLARRAGEGEPRYNATLGQAMPVVAWERGAPVLRTLTWGLRSSFGGLGPLPNARSETAAASPVFRGALARRRCLVPANGFYEWLRSGRLRLPHLFTLRGEEPFAFAGLWEPGEPPRGVLPPPEAAPASGPLPTSVGTYAILTTAPNALVAPIHGRMPVLLTGEALQGWLGDEPLDEPGLRALTAPLPAERMAVRRVGLFVNNARNEGPRCLAPPETEDLLPGFG